jgi:anti-sigma B factor antagonist
MKQTSTQHGPVTVLALEGNLMGGPDASALHSTINDLVSRGMNRIVVDLSKVEYMNSSGLSLLIGGAGTVKHAGGTLVLANASAKIQSIIKITKLSAVLETLPSVEEAVRRLTA